VLLAAILNGDIENKAGLENEAENRRESEMLRRGKMIPTDQKNELSSHGRVFAKRDEAAQ
jgi:hypothetical protein